MKAFELEIEPQLWKCPSTLILNMWLESPNNLGWKGSLEVIWFHPLLEVGLASELEQHAQGLHNWILSISKAGSPTAFWRNLSRADWSPEEECFPYGK